MSEVLFSENGLVISEYIGPEIGWSVAEIPATSDRRRYQLTNNAGQCVTLSRLEWEALGEWFTRDCSPECEGPHLGLTWDRKPF